MVAGQIDPAELGQKILDHRRHDLVGQLALDDHPDAAGHIDIADDHAADPDPVSAPALRIIGIVRYDLVCDRRLIARRPRLEIGFAPEPFAVAGSLTLRPLVLASHVACKLRHVLEVTAATVVATDLELAPSAIGQLLPSPALELEPVVVTDLGERACVGQNHLVWRPTAEAVWKSVAANSSRG
jgi:hypothetical protein